MRSKGSLAPSFDTGVWGMGPASGRDAPCGVARSTVERGLACLVRFRRRRGTGYCSDFGRTVQIGEPTTEFSRVYDVVMEAQAAGIRAVRPGSRVRRCNAAYPPA